MELQSFLQKLFEHGVIITALKVSIALTVFALGLQATLADATHLFRHPSELGRAFLAMNIVMPILALVLAIALPLRPPVKLALVALSVSPVPPMFPRRAVKLGDRQNYSVGLLVAMGIVSIIVIPVAMEGFERISGVPLRMPVGRVAVLVFTSLLAPLLAGIAVRAIAAGLARRLAHPLSAIATILLVLSVLPIAVASFRTILSLVGDGTLLSFAGFALVGYFIGDFLGRPGLEKRGVLALATSTRHPAIAAAIAHLNFPQQKLAVPAIALYLVVSAVITAIASKRKPSSAEHKQIRPRMAA